MHDIYKIEGTSNLATGLSYLDDPKNYPKFQEQLEVFKSHILNLVDKKESKTLFRLGDGEYWFLNKMPIGSATPGIGYLSKPYSEMKMDKFLSGVTLNDINTSFFSPRRKIMFKKVFGDKEFDYPIEFIYGLTANRWFFQNISKIGLIGADTKIELIKRLMKQDQYREYICRNNFSDYISIPQKLACDDVDEIENTLRTQLANTTSNVFLVGIGIVKTAVLHKLKDFKKAIYIDVGCGIDALAGVIHNYTRYFGSWVNFKIKYYDYSNVYTLTGPAFWHSLNDADKHKIKEFWRKLD